MRRVKNRIGEALDRRQWPRDSAELYLLAGCLSALMAAAATNLGYPQEAEELTRSGWVYATIIDHRPLMARLRLCAAYAAYWHGRHSQAADLARSGLGYLADGQNAAQLHLFAGLASARRGDGETARHAIAAAAQARERDHVDELLEIGGEFGFSAATHHYYAGFVLSEAGRGEAVAELERATGLYRSGPGPGEQHSRRCQMLAHTELAIVRLRSGGLEAAIAALEPVMTLPPGERTAVQVTPPGSPQDRADPPAVPELAARRKTSTSSSNSSVREWSGCDPSRQPLIPGRSTRAVIVACMTANGTAASSANASPRHTTRVRPALTTEPVIVNCCPAAGASRLIVKVDGQHRGLGRHDAVGRVPARAVQDRGHRPGVQEPVLLGEPVVMPQHHLHPAPLDRGQLDAERVHHPLPVEAGAHPLPHRVDRFGRPPLTAGFCHPPIVSPPA